MITKEEKEQVVGLLAFIEMFNVNRFEEKGNKEDFYKKMEYAISCVEKQIPKKPTKEHGYFRCQDCGHPFTNDEFDRKVTHCECGQAILWENEP